MRVVLGVSGASGAALAMDCARALIRAGAEIDLVLSTMAPRTLLEEIGPGAEAELMSLNFSAGGAVARHQSYITYAGENAKLIVKTRKPKPQGRRPAGCSRRLPGTRKRSQRC